MVMRLRLALHGHRNYKIYHLVAINQKARRDGKPAELLGIYDPHLPLGVSEKKVEWSVDRIRYWLSVGAQPSKAAEKLLILGNLLEPKPLPVTKFPKLPMPSPTTLVMDHVSEAKKIKTQSTEVPPESSEQDVPHVIPRYIPQYNMAPLVDRVPKDYT